MNGKKTDLQRGAGKTPGAGRRRALRVTAAALLLASMVALVLLHGAARQEAKAHAGEGSTPFDRQKWVDADPEDGQREEMLDDLRQHHLELGMRRQEVLKLLGEPGPRDRHPCLKPLSREAADTLCYTISVGLDPCTFLLGFDGAGRLMESVKDCS